eukprot:823171-Prymnesium_polylepis.1
MLARSCTERACAARKEKNVSRSRDGLGSGSRRSRCAPRRRRGPAEAVARCDRRGGLEAVEPGCHE